MAPFWHALWQRYTKIQCNQSTNAPTLIKNLSDSSDKSESSDGSEAAARGGNKKAPGFSARGSGGGYLLSHFRSTIGVVRLNFSVRNGKRWIPHAITTLVRFIQADVAFDGAPVCLGVSLTDKLVFAFLYWMRVFQSFLTAEPSEAVRRIPALFGAGSTFCLFFFGACAPESVRAISTARLNTSP